MVGAAAKIATGILTVTGVPEYVEFAVAMVLMVGILVGSYLFVIVPTPRRQGKERDHV